MMVENWVVDVPLSSDILPSLLRTFEISSFWFGMVCTLLFSIALAVMIKELLHTDPAVIVNAQGISVPGRKKFMGWDQLNHVEFANSKYCKFITLHARSPEIKSITLPTTLTLTPQEIVDEIYRSYAQFLNNLKKAEE